MSSSTKSRFYALDLIRAAAIFSVIAGHYFCLNTDFHEQAFIPSFKMVFQGMCDFLFFMGVPLFLMLTGYLNVKKKEYSWEYVWGMRKVLFSYLFFSVVMIVFRKLYLLEEKSWVELCKGILDFSAIPYAWYIEMWIGLYLLTPMLNRAYDAFGGDKKQIQWLLAVLVLMTFVPDFTNRYGLYVFPAFWQTIFPITYFYIGRYIREFGINIKSWILILIVLVTCAINPITTAILSDGVRNMVYLAGASRGIFGAMMSVSAFVLLMRLGEKAKRPSWIITRLSILSLDMYLCSYIADQIVYPYSGARFFVAVPAVILLSCLMSEVKGLIFRLIRL